MFLENLDSAIAFAVMMLLLSLIITTLVQMLAGLLSLRGTILLWGTRRLLEQLDPRLKTEAEKLARSILTHPALSHRAKKMATAMRSNELVLVLGQIARGELAKAADDAAADAKPGFSQDTLEALRDLFQDKVDPTSPALEAKAQELIGRLTATFGEEKVADLRAAVLQTFGKTSEIVVRVDAWFETVMDRTSERFKVGSRYITVGFALIFGLALQVDSLSLYRRLSTDQDLRGRLVSMADAVSDQAEKLIDSAQNQDTSASPEAFKERLDGLQKSLTELQAKVESTTPGLLPDRASWSWSRYGDPLAWVGMLMTVVFLSLGAPFWFNALRTLSALKPVVANKVVEEEKKTV